jgi:CBS domain-containing protein
MMAADIMTTEVVAVGPDADVAEVASLLLANNISAAPVVDDEGHILGMVSEADLMRRAGGDRPRRWWLALFADETAAFTRTHGTRARDVMTGDVVSIGKDATLAEIARTLESRRIKRVAVVEDGRLAGIVSRSDVLRGLASLRASGRSQRAGSDLAIQQQIIALIKNHTSVPLQAISVVVDGGEVCLWGRTATEEQHQAVRVAAESVVGPDKVNDYL